MIELCEQSILCGDACSGVHSALVLCECDLAPCAGRIWLDPNEASEISMANSRFNIRKLIKDGLVHALVLLRVYSSPGLDHFVQCTGCGVSSRFCASHCGQAFDTLLPLRRRTCLSFWSQTSCKGNCFDCSQFYNVLSICCLSLSG